MAEDFLMEESFVNFCLERNLEDAAFWNRWLETHPEKVKEVDLAKQLYYLLNGYITATELKENKLIFLEKFQAISSEEEMTMMQRNNLAFRKRAYLKSAILSIAAAAVIAAFLLVFRMQFNQTKKSLPATDHAMNIPYLQISKPGERKAFQLPDGTQVTLNAGSVIHISDQFNKKNREISLEGEAFFDVARNPLKPFIIHTAHMDVRVMGTVFNVRAYPSDNEVETALVSGSVEVLLKENQKRIILHPNEKVVLPISISGDQAGKAADRQQIQNAYRISGLAHHLSDSTVSELSWIQNRLIFEHTRFGDLARQLERWYDVHIEFRDTAIMEYRYTATFDKNTIIQVLEALKLSRNFNYYMDDNNKIIISK
ncbi:MAG: DUF4974 domain-containing protein [Chitinophagaceae bacterium]|nr:DUF4974 domain-containing protein [Chitinophagaceae bacterium]